MWCLYLDDRRTLMLTHTFCHIPRISLNKEMALWEQGILCWEDYRKSQSVCGHLDDSERHLQDKNPAFFGKTLKSDQYWRLFPHFRDSIAYIDIETTGLDKGYDQITTIALFDGREIFTYVNGKNLADFKRDIQNYKIIVTYNGRCFDAPFIENYFNIKLDQVHIDLRYPLRRLGFMGGLKAIEQRLGIERGELRSVDGFFAVRLWHEYKRKKDEKALETLLAYNCADVVNLEILLTTVFNRNLEATPFKTQGILNAPAEFKIPFQADARLLDRLN